MRASDDRVERPDLPMRADARAAVDTAFALVAERRRDLVHAYSLLFALIREEGSPVAELLGRYGADLPRLTAYCEQAL